MSGSNTQLIKIIYQAFNSRDYEGVLMHFAPGVEWISAESSPLADQSPYKGIEVIRSGVFGRIAAAFEKLTVEIDEIFEGEGRVVVLGHYHGRFEGRVDDFVTQVAHIWSVEGGRAQKFQQYTDTLKIARDAAAAT